MNEGVDPERERVFGDNDRLAALVAAGMGADLLVLLTNVDGLYTAPPERGDARRLSSYSPDIPVHFGSASRGGTGGMQAKIAASRVAADAGVATVIGSGYAPDTLLRVLDGQDVGTWFPPGERMNRRRRWLAYATAPDCNLVVNDGAHRAMVQRQASLLAIGVEQVRGEFLPGEAIGIGDSQGRIFAHGVATCSSDEARQRQGTQGGRPVVHRDDVVILEELGGEMRSL